MSAAGAAQFCRRTAFEAVGGFDETILMGEDVEFYWRLSKYARRVLLLTHPLVIWLGWRRRSLWREWYDAPIR